MSGVWPGVLEYAVIAVAPALLIWAMVRLLPVLFDLPERIGRRRRARRPLTLARPFETLVADLHRLRREMRSRAPVTRVRRIALAAAYDDVLQDLCRATGVARPPLGEVPEPERPFARLQTEAALEAAGVPLDPPRRGSAAA